MILLEFKNGTIFHGCKKESISLISRDAITKYLCKVAVQRELYRHFAFPSAKLQLFFAIKLT